MHRSTVGERNRHADCLYIHGENVSGLTILVAEDDADIRDLVSVLLRQHGYDVVAARDGLEALRLAREHYSRISLILTDFAMPRLNGAGLARQVHRDYPRIPVLYITARERELLLPRDINVVWKPFQPEELLSTVRRLIKPPFPVAA